MNVLYLDFPPTNPHHQYIDSKKIDKTSHTKKLFLLNHFIIFYA